MQYENGQDCWFIKGTSTIEYAKFIRYIDKDYALIFDQNADREKKVYKHDIYPTLEAAQGYLYSFNKGTRWW